MEQNELLLKKLEEVVSTMELVEDYFHNALNATNFEEFVLHFRQCNLMYDEAKKTLAKVLFEVQFEFRDFNDTDPSDREIPTAHEFRLGIESLTLQLIEDSELFNYLTSKLCDEKREELLKQFRRGFRTMFNIKEMVQRKVISWID